MAQPSLRFTIRRDGAVTTVAVGGEIDIATACSLEAELLRLLDLDTTALVLDFTDVTFCDSQGIGALMAVRRRATEVGARLDVINVQSIVMRVMEVTGVVDALRARPA